MEPSISLPEDWLVLSRGIAGASLLSLLVAWWNTRRASPILAIVNRWLRLLIFASALALTGKLLVLLGLVDWYERPFWSYLAAAFLLCVLLGTLYNWLAIRALSLSPLPLFPRFVPMDEKSPWPMHKGALRLRTQLREAGYQPVAAFRAELLGGIDLRNTVFQSSDGKTRLQVLFVPQPGGNHAICLSLASVTEGGRRIQTDNLYIPFGGFYPDYYEIQRHPWIRSFRRLLARHRRRCAKASEALVIWEVDPLADLNTQQRVLEQINTELGFLHNSAEREELGKITPEGRYRVWKEMLLLNYLGIASGYRH